MHQFSSLRFASLQKYNQQNLVQRNLLHSQILMLKYFRASFIFTAICLWLAFYVWWTHALFITIMLAILEVSLSFDNAIINAKEIEKMNAVWRRRFLTRWMIIAVFGMRIIFPVAIVSIIWDVSMRQALQIAFQDPSRYQAIIESSHIALAAFGWSFLFMVFLWFFLDETKKIHWVNVIETKLAKLWKLESIEVIVALLTMRGVTKLPWFPTTETWIFLTAGIMWLIVFLIISALSKLLQDQEQSNTNSKWLAWWFGTFMYLEILDASFSFDGVIWAFALTKNIIIIALWLGIGAMFVRSLTLMLVEKKTLSHFKYLEHGAFWAIGLLAAIMFLSSTYHIPEVFTWVGSWVLILIAFLHSKYGKKSHT